MACNESLKKKLMFGTISLVIIVVLIIVIVANVNSSQTKIRFVHISDTHSLTSHIKSIPDGDVLLHTGDFTYKKSKGLNQMEQVIQFNDWLGTLPHKHKIVIAGNHDFSFDSKRPEGQNGTVDKVKSALTNAIYLQDSWVEIDGLKIYGSPWVPLPDFKVNWAFGLQRGEEILEKWKKIPNDTNILMTHSPPYGFGDKISNGEHVGSKDLLNIIKENVGPKFHVFGHIHEDYGIRTEGETTFINAAFAGPWKGYPAYSWTNKTAIVFDVLIPRELK